jgi:hypothetical protein
MEEPIISTTEEGENEPQLNEDHAYRVFLYPRHCSSRIRPPGPDRQYIVLLRILRRLRENIWRKQPDPWRAKNWILHDDNAPRHRALLVREFLANHNMLSLLCPPYSPDLSPADFFLLPKMKMQLKGRRFHTVAKIADYHTHVITKTPI